MSHLMTQTQDVQNKVNSLDDAKELYDPETATSSGASHVPSQALLLDTRGTMGTSGNVF